MKTAAYDLQGFTLVEMAIVLLIITLALGGLLTPMARQAERRHMEDTQKQLEEIRAALLGYAITQKKLPCPDISSPPDGLGDCPVTTSPEAIGALPWRDIGVGGQDAWNHHYRYAVTSTLTSSIATTTNASGTLVYPDGSLTVNNGSGVTYLTNAMAVVISHGANGLGAPGTTSTASTADEQENTDADAIFRSRETTTAFDISQGSGLAEFDDQLSWLPSTVLINQMVTAGQLP